MSERLSKEREAEHRHCAHNMTAVSSDRLRECLAELDAVRAERDQAREEGRRALVDLLRRSARPDTGDFYITGEYLQDVDPALWEELREAAELPPPKR